jgi:hypothetical protein
LRNWFLRAALRLPLLLNQRNLPLLHRRPALKALSSNRHPEC